MAREKKRFAALREQHTKTLATIAKHGRSGKMQKRDQIAQLTIFSKQFRLVPKQF